MVISDLVNIYQIKFRFEIILVLVFIEIRLNLKAAKLVESVRTKIYKNNRRPVNTECELFLRINYEQLKKKL